LGQDTPFIIWTLQRTGSTNLLRILMYLSSYRTAESEGFDPESPERQFAWVPGAQYRTHALRRITRQRWNIKHVVDRLPMEFNAALARETTRAGYSHIVLDRRDAAARMASLTIAERHGTWDPTERTARVLNAIGSGEIEIEMNAEHLARRQIRAQAMLDEIRNVLRAAGAIWREVAFEDLYVGLGSERISTFAAVARHVGVHWERDTDRIVRLLEQGGQNTGAALAAIPDTLDLRAALAAD
jgi:hypothetical protein